jgi:hypothetical protein
MIIIDTCDKCKHFNKKLWDETDGYSHEYCYYGIDCSPNFGCIDWEEKPKDDSRIKALEENVAKILNMFLETK